MELLGKTLFQSDASENLAGDRTVIAVIKLHRPISSPMKASFAADFSRSRIDVPTRGEVGSARETSPQNTSKAPLPRQWVLHPWGFVDALASTRVRTTVSIIPKSSPDQAQRANSLTKRGLRPSVRCYR